MRLRLFQKISIYIVLSLFSIFFLFPILTTLTNSFMRELEVLSRYSMYFNSYNSFDAITKIHFSEITLIPTKATLKQYFSLLFDSAFYIGLFFNSVRITVPIVIGQLLIAVPTAYVFEMSRFRFKEAIFLVYIVIMLLPLQVTIVPNYIIAEFLKINGGTLPIILPAVFSPFGVFLIRQFLKGMPNEYIEAAKIDGANNAQVFLQIILPAVKPAIAALAILTFVEYWNTVDQAVVFISEVVREPLSVYLSKMTTENNMRLVFSASCFYMLPPVLIFLYGQEYMTEGISLSGIK